MSRLLIMLILVPTFALSMSNQEQAQQKLTQISKENRATLVKEIEKSDLNEAEAAQILSEYDNKVASDVMALEKLSEEEITDSGFLTHPLYCYYAYYYHIRATYEVVEYGTTNFTFDNAGTKVIMTAVTLPIALVIDAVMTPFNAYLAYTEAPVRRGGQKHWNCP